MKKRLLSVLLTLSLLCTLCVSASAMTIEVKTLTGDVFGIEAELGDSIDNLKAKIEEKTGIPSTRQVIIYAGKRLEDGRTLSCYDYQKGDRLHLLTVPDKTRTAFGTTNYRLIHTYIDGEGTVEPSGTVMVRDGSDKAFTLIPAAGYEVGDVVVNHKSLGAVTSFTVKDIDTDTSVEVTFVKSGNAVVGTGSARNPSTGVKI